MQATGAGRRAIAAINEAVERSDNREALLQLVLGVTYGRMTRDQVKACCWELRSIIPGIQESIRREGRVGSIDNA